MTRVVRVRNWLHRSGYGRLLNCSSNNFNQRATAYVETRGPEFIGRRVAFWVVRNSSLTKADWLTIKATDVQRISRWRYRWFFHYSRIRS